MRQHYRVYCFDESRFIHTWSETAPTVCPNNGGHTVGAILFVDDGSIGGYSETRVDDLGNIGIIKTAAVGSSLEIGYLESIKGDASSNGLFIQASDNSGTIPFHIENFDGSKQILHVDAFNNRVGFGTANPTEKLDVSGNIAVTGTVDGRDVALDGTNQDNHIASTSNPHSVTIDQVTPTTTKGDLIVENGANAVRFPVGSNNQVIIANSAQSAGIQWVNASSLGNSVQTTVITDVKSIGTNGGTFTKNIWQTRTLNTIVQSHAGITLSANRITIPAGTYYIHAHVPAYRVDNHQARLRNITDNTTVVVGTSQSSNSLNGSNDSDDEGTSQNGPSFITHQFTIASTKVFEIQHRCTKTRSGDGFGISAGISGSEERYTVVTIHKIA